MPVVLSGADKAQLRDCLLLTVSEREKRVQILVIKIKSTLV